MKILRKAAMVEKEQVTFETLIAEKLFCNAFMS